MADVSSEKVIYFYGDLDLKIVEARCLPNMDMMSERLRVCFTPCEVACIPSAEISEPRSADQKVKHHRKLVTSDPYVTVNVPQATIARTRVVANSQHPHWNEGFVIPLAHPMGNLEFVVKDNDAFGAQIIGTVKIPASRIVSGELISGWFPILGQNNKPPKPDSALHLEIKFIPCEKNSLYRQGIADDHGHLGVRNTYFPLRKGGSMTLYKDAHACLGLSPEIKLDKERIFKQEKCWEDICHAILEAHHLIYVAGWSVFHKVKLVREATRALPRGGDLTLGELLKYKSEEGVRVLLLVWDDKTSHSKFFINTEGVMQTHDEETKKFFRNSSVICALSPRYASSKLSYMKQKVVGSIFTHHQKCVLVDTQAFGNNRKITAFIGGLDLCDGRYDTPEHRLFKDLETVFKDDFHNPTFLAGVQAPRQPWHDLHCKIEGPAAYDVLVNFEQRWIKARKWKEFGLLFKRVSSWHDDALLKIGRISWIHSPPLSSSDSFFTSVPKDEPLLHVSGEHNSETWHVQIFRSIDSGSVKGFPKRIKDVLAQNLECSKDLTIERSIQTAYIQAIRSAQHFIYIENQYFIGSSYAWPTYKAAGADNLIPMELALKIVSKIRAKQRFAVYVVIPMWPEGDPKSATVQEILYWQSQTIEMMYRVIAQELASSESDQHPLDFLNFYCLGNREEMPNINLGTQSSNTVSDSQKFGRFMIYVHAKGMIVDDEYLILGSANINQRSLAGTKDTEIAMGSYQPHYSWANCNGHPHGQVYGYRMSLWGEHLGGVEQWMEEAGSIKCVKQVNAMAEENWKKFTSHEFMTLQGHLLKYPLLVDSDGKVRPLPGDEYFPDVGGKIIGAHSYKLPDVLTT